MTDQPSTDDTLTRAAERAHEAVHAIVSDRDYVAYANQGAGGNVLARWLCTGNAAKLTEHLADALIAAGYVRTPVDATQVERMRAAMDVVGLVTVRADEREET